MVQHPRLREVADDGTHTAEVGAAQAYLRLKGAWRLTHLLLIFVLFAVRIWINRRGWFGRHTIPQRELRRREGEVLRDRLVTLGPTFIKLGQMLAMRFDLLPAEYLQALVSLQDSVPPFPTKRARTIIAQELGATPETLFARFNPIPVASASLGQVYRARLKTGQEVVVKVQRPGLVPRIEVDLAVLRCLVCGLDRFRILPCEMDWLGMLEEFRATIFRELDYVQEVQHAEIFRKHFARWRDVYVPRIYPELSTRQVLVMEYITGLKVTETAQLAAAGHNPRRVVTLLVRTYLKQLLEDGFFHADPHPGNLRVMADGRLAFFDFGMIGRLPRTLQAALLEAFGHLITRDVPGLVDDMEHLGLLTIPPEAAPHVTPLIAAIVERYVGRPLSEVSLHTLLLELAPMLAALPVRIPAHFTFILRALMTLEGIGMMVDPHFKLFEVARPHALRYTLMREGRYWGGLLLTRLLSGEAGSIEWDKLLKLADLALTYLTRRGVTQAH
jgi:predicted unusual protein kinase regulating ubiquinone biosynthesis (AarF/ABC1/UbiB family)